MFLCHRPANFGQDKDVWDSPLPVEFVTPEDDGALSSLTFPLGTALAFNATKPLCTVKREPLSKPDQEL